MLNTIKITLSVLVLISFSACASMFVPGSEEISKLPVIKMGSKKPEGNEYILHIPKGEKIPWHFTINGGLISAPVDSKSVTKINQEIYVYKYWASFDGKNWKPTGELLNMPISFGVGPEGGQLNLKVDVIK